MRNPEKTIGLLIEKEKLAFLSSMDEFGFPNTKALQPRLREGIKTFYFSTNTSSQKVKQFLSCNKASLYYYEKRFFRGVLFKGFIEVVLDLSMKQKLWKSEDAMFYPKGVEDEDYCVLKFTAVEGRYYSHLKNEDFLIQ